MKDGFNFCVAYMFSESHTVASIDCLFVCLQLQRVHILFSQREFTHVTWSRVPEPLLSAILIVYMGFFKLYYISPTAGCVVSAGCAGVLRTVPTIVIAHTFCASPDTRISHRQYLLIQGSFCAV